MNREIRDEWVKRLRSGDYDQSSNALHNDNGYCCLGVLCEIAVEKGVIKSPTQVDEGHAFVYERSVSYLPRKVVRWAGINQRGTYGKGSNLAKDNDNGHTFDDIANIIEVEFND